MDFLKEAPAFHGVILNEVKDLSYHREALAIVL
jgi:hypothetical protein